MTVGNSKCSNFITSATQSYSSFDSTTVLRLRVIFFQTVNFSVLQHNVNAALKNTFSYSDDVPTWV